MRSVACSESDIQFLLNKDLDKNYHRVSAGWEHEYLLVCDMNSEFM